MQKDSPTDFTLLVASVDTRSETHEFEIGNSKGKLTVKYGDYSADMAKVNEALKKVRLMIIKVEPSENHVLTDSCR